MSFNMNWIKVGFINTAVLIALLLLIEILFRTHASIRSCLANDCDFSYFTDITIAHLQKDVASNFIGISRFDDELGYVPNENFSDTITNKRGNWLKAKVSISSEGFRLNDNFDLHLEPADVLVVGESFAFGDQVSNNETWAACLERKLQRGVDNGGVFGYGAEQALKRAIIKISQKKYSTIIFSILVDASFERARFRYRSGFAKPSLVKSGNEIVWSDVSNPNRQGTKYNPIRHNPIIMAAYDNSLLLKKILEIIISEDELYGDRLTEAHPNAADKDTILRYILTRFNSLPVKNKIILLNYVDSYRGSRERDAILEAAKTLSFKIVDTYDELQKHQRMEIWKGHYTPYGNKVVCQQLLEYGFMLRPN